MSGSNPRKRKDPARAAIPAALHSELSEYSSLLRSLRTTSTLDITSHLVNSRREERDEGEGEDEDEDEGSLVDDEEGPAPVPAEKTGGEPFPTAGPSTAKVKGKQKQKARPVKDSWTRWPLLPNDVHIPEFSFQDEIKLLASTALARASAISAPENTPMKPSQRDGEGEEEAGDMPAFEGEGDYSSSESDLSIDGDLQSEIYLKAITHASAHHLSSMLGAIAAHVPIVAKSQQNRMAPIGWEGVLNIVGGSGLVDAAAIARVQQRMEAIAASGSTEGLPSLKPSSSKKTSTQNLPLMAVPRVAVATASKRKLDDLFAPHDAALLHMVPTPPPAPIKKARKPRAKKQKKEKTVVSQGEKDVNEEHGEEDSL